MKFLLNISICLLLLTSTGYAQQWYFAWDGTADIACTPCVDGANPFFQSSAASPLSSWSIVDNGSGGKALRTADISESGEESESLRWKGFGSRPEFYRGPCSSFAMENVNPDHNAFTLVFRIRAEDYNPGGSNPNKIKRIFNCEFETTIPNPHSDYPYYTFRVEFGLHRDPAGNIWLADFRYGDRLALLRAAGGKAEWHTIWAMVQPPEGLDQAESIYRLWDNGVEVDWRDRDKGGWSDCDIGWDGGREDNRTATFEFDYLCYGYDAWQPGEIAIPAEAEMVAADSIATARNQEDGTPVELTDKIVVGIFDDPGTTGGKITGGKPLPPEIEKNIALTKKYEPRFAPDVDMKFYYIAEPDGSDFIKVQYNTGLPAEDPVGNPVTLQVGDRVTVKGGLGSAECEKQIMAHEIIRTDIGMEPPEPVSLEDEDIHKSFNAALYDANPPQLLDEEVSGNVVELTATTITDLLKDWSGDQWKHLTAIVPARGRHPDFYYYVNSNTDDTLILSSRVLPHEHSINILFDGVSTEDTYFFPGGREKGPRLDGAFLTTTGSVTAVNPIAGYFDIDDGAGSGDTRTIQDIWNTQEYRSTFTPPAGVRIFHDGGLPRVGEYVKVTGCLGHYRFKYRKEPDWTSRDEVQIDKVMPVVWAREWIPFVKVSPTPTPTWDPSVPTYTPTPSWTPTPTSTASPTATATWTATPTATATPLPGGERVILNNSTVISIPGYEANETYTSTILIGQPMRIEFLAVSVDITHAARGNLEVTLTSPSGKVATIWNQEGGVSPDLVGRFELPQFVGEQGMGIWTLTITDHQLGYGGQLNNWSLEIFRTLQEGDFDYSGEVDQQDLLELLRASQGGDSGDIDVHPDNQLDYRDIFLFSTYYQR